MTKKEFISELSERISGFSESDVKKSLDFYSEMIDDRVESGMSEDEAVSELGTPENAANEIMLEMPLPKIIKKKCGRKNGFKPLEIIMLVLGSPIWLSVGIVLASVVISFYIVLWAVLISLWAVVISIGAAALAGFIAGVASVVFGNMLTALIYIGMGIFCSGLTLISGYGCVKLVKPFISFSVSVMRAVKSLFIGKGRTNEKIS